MIKISNIEEVRKALWHLRHGGVKQLRTHLRRVAARSAQQNTLMRTGKGGQLGVQPWELPEDVQRRPQLNVAVILDDFSRLAWKFEWNQITVTPGDWREKFTTNPIDMLFVESAWNGNSGAWQYKLTGSSAPDFSLRQLVQYCSENNIPTVFWNKEDPVHFSDFIDTAKLFDFVFTTDVELVDQYKEHLGHSRVDVLPFAAQSAIHNPVRPRTGFHDRDIAFGGMYFSHRHPERREQIEWLLGAAHDVSPRMKYGLEIYSRFHGKDEKYQFPSPLDERVRGSLSYPQMLSAYRLHKVFLNVNTVVGSPSMCARRIFEITASGTPVVSTPSPAISEFFPNQSVIQVHDRQEAGYALRALVADSELRDRTVHEGQRRIWRHHTYEVRANQVLNAVGLSEHATEQPTASILISTNRPQQVEHALQMAGGQEGVESETLLLAHGFELSSERKNELQEKFSIENLEVMSAPSTLTLGDCLNLLVQAASGDVVAKFDDDDFYSKFYLADQIMAMKYANAEVVGKNARYVYLENSKRLILRSPAHEHMYTNFIAGPTIVAMRDLAIEAPFESRSIGEDTAFLERVTSLGGKIYASDRFNFIQYRRAATADSKSNHTWQASDWELAADSRFVSNQWLPSQVIV